MKALNKIIITVSLCKDIISILEVHRFIALSKYEKTHMSHFMWCTYIYAVFNCDLFPQLWDVEQQKRVRKMTGHVARVGSLSWNSFILTRYCKVMA